jgi:hypothetical protein
MYCNTADAAAWVSWPLAMAASNTSVPASAGSRPDAATLNGSLAAGLMCDIDACIVMYVAH